MNVAHMMRNASSHNCTCGIVLHWRVAISFTESGSDIIAEKKKIHFMKVTMEYLEITGLNAPRYIANARPLRNMRAIPPRLLSISPPVLAVLLRMRNNIPDKLSSTPPAFWNVMGSLSTRAAMNIV